MLWKKKKVEQSNRDQGHWEGGFDWHREVWVGFTGEVPQNKHWKTVELIMWLPGKEHSRYRRQHGTVTEGMARGQCG